MSARHRSPIGEREAGRLDVRLEQVGAGSFDVRAPAYSGTGKRGGGEGSRFLLTFSCFTPIASISSSLMSVLALTAQRWTGRQGTGRTAASLTWRWRRSSRAGVRG